MSVWNLKVRTFFATEAAGGIFLVRVAALALALANSPIKAGFFNFTDHSHNFVNEFLMSIFFFLVGMIAPALIYLAFNAGGLASNGWAIPMPTDIALALGALALLSSRIDSSLKIFLLTLAIADDLFSIVVLAVFYSSGIEPIRIIGTVGAVILAFMIPSCIRIPITGSNPKAKRIEFRCPDPSSNPYLAFAAMLMAGLDGIINKIEPADPVDKDLYELTGEEAAAIAQVPGSLDEALNNLERDHEFLLKGGVFTKDLIDTWIDFKRKQEVDYVRLRPHPAEFELYFDL